tara:strand:+ start:23230 stop:24363 length:1134 start_codon:yes stop_codon:yes gene_type:complete
MSKTFKIPAHNMSWVHKQAEQVSKKLRKYNLPAIKVEVLGTDMRSVLDLFADHGSKAMYEYLRVNITIPEIDLGQWRYAGATFVYEDEAKVMRGGAKARDGQQVEEFREQFAHDAKAARHCDHCNVFRYRKGTTILQEIDSGNLMQVGTSCLIDFTGLKDAEAFARLAEQVAGLEVSVGEVEQGQRWESAVLPSQDGAVAKLDIVDVVAASLRDGHGQRVWTSLIAGDVVPQDREKAGDVISYFRALEGQVASIFKRTAVGQSELHHINWGIKRYHADKREQEAEKAASLSVFVGAKGDTVETKGKITSVKSWQGNWGPVATHTMISSASGCVFVWFATAKAKWFAEGDTVSIRGTVKYHKPYRGVSQTVLMKVREQ